METSKSIWWVIPLWLVAVITCFWWFEYRHWQNFQELSITFDGQQLEGLYSKVEVTNQITVMHFVDKECPCYTYSEAHVQRLQASLIHTKQITVTDPEMTSVPATPSVAVWDQNGELAYFGPYSSGAVCGKGKDFVSRVLAELNSNSNPRWINTLGVGCYCSVSSREV